MHYQVVAIRKKTKRTKKQKDNDDQIFCNLIYEMLQQICNCKDKDIVKLSVQHMLIEKKHQLNRRMVPVFHPAVSQSSKSWYEEPTFTNAPPSKPKL